MKEHFLVCLFVSPVRTVQATLNFNLTDKVILLYKDKNLLEHLVSVIARPYSSKLSGSSGTSTDLNHLNLLIQDSYGKPLPLLGIPWHPEAAGTTALLEELKISDHGLPGLSCGTLLPFSKQ